MIMPREGWERKARRAKAASAQAGLGTDSLTRRNEGARPDSFLSSSSYFSSLSIFLLPTYNKGGAMESVLVKNSIDAPESRVSVERVAYNARGQRVLIAYGNGIMTQYRYDKVNFRLTRMKSEKYSKNDLTYTPNNGIKQNFAYTYDLAGNILTINDKTTGCGYGATPNELTREFEYDPLYRLSSANGREKDTVLPSEWDETYYPEDTTAKRFYTQNYEYDKMGNIQLLQHVASVPFTREFTYDSEKNTLASIEVGSNTYNFTHDVNGNITEEGTSRKFEFDYADRLRAFKVQVGSAEPSQYAHYLYDAGGSRVKKIVRTQNGDYTSVTYIDGIFEHIREGNPGPSIPELAIGEWVIGQEDVQFGISGTKIGETFIVGASAAYGMREQNLLHVMDGNSRMATIRVGNDFGDTTPEVKYNLEDHLGSSTLVLSENGSLISGEEYYPFGETSFGSYGKKRYRFCGKEKDGESGLYYYGARYYSAWTCRFINVDPLAKDFPQLTPYNYAGNKAITHKDLYGLQGTGDRKPATNSGNSTPAATGTKTTPIPKVDNTPRRDATRVSPAQEQKLGDVPKSITAGEAARLADNVYGGPDAAKLLGGWVKSETKMAELTKSGVKFEDPKSGFKSALYARTNKDGVTEYAYVTAGTDTDKMKNFQIDIHEDFKQAFGSNAPQYKLSVENALKINNNLPYVQLTFVGHSLGGGLASANALATGRSAITFNAAGLHPNTKSDFNLYQEAKIDAYVIRGEIVDSYQRQLEPSLKAEGDIHYLDAKPIVTNRARQRLEYHFMGQVMQKMKEQGIK